MVFNLKDKLQDKLQSKDWWVNFIFYFSLALFTANIFVYVNFFLSSYFIRKEINDLNSKIASYGTERQRLYQKEVLEYRDKINDFASIIGNRRISSSIFSFIEDKTLPNVWFSNFDMSKSVNEIRLAGESINMESLSRQVKSFEDSKDYIKSVNVFDSQTLAAGKIRFTINLSLNTNIFNYKKALSVIKSVNP